MAKIILVGDATSGKSTFLNYLESINAKFNIIFETGWQTMPPEIEKDKFQATSWFIEYFYDRDKATAGLDNLIMEREFNYQYPVAETSFLTGLITQEQKNSLIKRLDELSQDLPLDGSDLVIHCLVPNEIIRQRLLTRGLVKPKHKDNYWDVLRVQTEKYYRDKTDYVKIDTAALSPDDFGKKLLNLFKEKKLMP
ncbi:MAG: hypothetical protein A3A24_00845 [Candidatus Buchananbacteria bacterium RIFCSPLOWO2_01_FULL_46_12]|uniref:Deoxynucleoside kinase domain-containing protein n=1 Tax=Candidatus Buchananbacteria bacterium RIFCSPLOWO2_01_FULL_46_12 TaxID=1797546 RepID=A0A1G1YPH3_9BACT|nr:MAG: hypothetical protein A3A24_00845 [Candidatus Buchananbacteria bacterium RIFCSPLOWO2_01_FULL_46_12]